LGDPDGTDLQASRIALTILMRKDERDQRPGVIRQDRAITRPRRSNAVLTEVATLPVLLSVVERAGAPLLGEHAMRVYA